MASMKKKVLETSYSLLKILYIAKLKSELLHANGLEFLHASRSMKISIPDSPRMVSGWSGWAVVDTDDCNRTLEEVH